MGTMIGAGMLALPVVTGLSGFLPAIAINLVCCLFMMATGLLLLEAVLWLEDDVNLLTLAHHFLGKWGHLIAAISFLFLYYCLEVSYCAGGAPVFSRVINELFNGLTDLNPTGPFSYILFAGFFGTLVFLGTKAVSRINWILMTGLLLSFVLLIEAGSQKVSYELLKRADWKLSLSAAPVLFGAYGYHNILPSLSSYLKKNIRQLKSSIIFGSLAAFSIYSLWQWIIIGSLSLDDIMGADMRGEPITKTLQNIVGHPLLVMFGEYFGLFALTTSFLGVSLSMVDFLADGLNISSKGNMRLFLCLAVFVPPVIIAMTYPGIFIEAIGIAGGFGEAILNGLLPIAMVWVGRYSMNLPSSYSLFGGRPMLVFLTLFTLLIMGIEAHHLFFKTF